MAHVDQVVDVQLTVYTMATQNLVTNKWHNREEQFFFHNYHVSMLNSGKTIFHHHSPLKVPPVAK